MFASSTSNPEQSACGAIPLIFRADGNAERERARCTANDGNFRTFVCVVTA